MTFGVAIPTYSKHVFLLPKLLEILNNSTVIPDKVSISCSSFSENLNFENDYKFELLIDVTNDFRNPSQNRNIAGKQLDTDIISFIDGDDLPHFQRNEFIIDAFKNENVVALMHNYYQSPIVDERFIYTKYENPNLIVDYIDTVFPNGFTGSKNPNPEFAQHHAHISLRKSIFDILKYDENQDFIYREDTIYVKELVNNGNKISYIPNKLSQYIK